MNYKNYLTLFLHRSNRRLIRVVGLALVVVILWCLAYNRFQGAFSIPVMYNAVDTNFHLARIKIAQEGILPPNSMIFMLPSIDFPEPPGIPPYKYYYHARPFLYTNSLRYSYGSNKGRTGADWRHSIDSTPPEEIPLMLEQYGFSGILINREYYEDRGEALIRGLLRSVEFEQGVDNEWVFIRLTPVENPVLPTDTPYALTTQK